MCDLTIITFVDVEKDIGTLRCTLDGFCRWQSPEARARCQWIIIVQRPNAAEVHALCGGLPYPVDVFHDPADFVDGYPVWDVNASIRRAWPLVRGRYVFIGHAEFLWLPGRLAATLEWLAAQRPYLALGNLRRFGNRDDVPTAYAPAGRTRELSDGLTALLESGQYDAAADYANAVESLHWVYWGKPPVDGATAWAEDVFFIDKDFAAVTRAFAHGGELPFQDCYDTTAKLCYYLGKYSMAPRVERAPRRTHEALHLWHRKQWGSFTPAMREWFEAAPARWRETAFLRRDLWMELVAFRRDPLALPRADTAVVSLRQGPGGTCTRYAGACSQWLREGGADLVTEFYQQHGRDRREA